MVTDHSTIGSSKLFHCNGAIYSSEWKACRDRIMRRAPLDRQVIDGLSLVTWNSPPGRVLLKPLGQFERSAKQFGYDVDVLAVPYPWNNNRDKIRLVVDYLATVTTPYVLAADSADVLVIDALEEVIAEMETYQCDLLFSANVGGFVRAGILELHQWQKAICPATDDGKPRFLDAGMWIGKTSYCRGFFDKALVVANEMQACPESEQACIIAVYRDEHPRTQIDRCRRIFQTPFGASPREQARKEGV